MKKFISPQNPVFGALLLTFLLVTFTIIGEIYNFGWIKRDISSYFSGFSTLLVGLYAFVLYRKQKDDLKKDLAQTILLEIQNAEKSITTIQKTLELDRSKLSADLIVMPTESWKTKKYLFVGNFDSNQWEAISNFYNACAVLDDAIKTNSSYFQKNEEQIRINIHERSAELSKEYENKILIASSKEESDRLLTEFKKKVTFSSELYLGVSGESEYKPTKTIHEAERAIEQIKENKYLPDAVRELKDLAK